MRKRLKSTFVAFLLAAALTPIRLGIRGPEAMRAFAAIRGAAAATRADHGQRLMLAKDDFFDDSHRDVRDVGDHGDDRDDGGDADHDRDDHHHHGHHHHHRHHHSGDHDDDDGDGGGDEGRH